MSGASKQLCERPPGHSGALRLQVGWQENPQKALDAVRDADPYYTTGVAQYELLMWNVVIGKDNLDKL